MCGWLPSIRMHSGLFLSNNFLIYTILQSGSGLVLPRAADVLRGWDVYTLIPVVSNVSIVFLFICCVAIGMSHYLMSGFCSL